MTASTTTAANKKGSAEPGYDKTAQRILNLFFVLNSSAEPLTTEQIVLDSDLGYGSGNVESDKRKFRRDREKLHERGIVIKEVRAPGAQETEESAWTVDRDHTFAAGGLITADDADILMDAIDQTLAVGLSTFSTPLADIRSKIAYLTGETDEPEMPAHRSPMVDAVWSAFAERCALRFLYQNGRGEQRQRTVRIYGMFEREGISYFCGLDDASGTVRTFRCDRIVRAWKPSGFYTIPSDFNLNDQLFFEFDFSDCDPIAATFSFAADTPADMVHALTRGRGSLDHAAEGWMWTVGVRDLDAAASFCMEHSVDGMRPVAPDALKQAWNRLIERTVNAHGRA